MKKKGLVIALVCVMGLATLIGSAQAALQWNNLTVFEVGEINGFYYITDLSSTAIQNNYYVIDPANKNAMLATALTCYANSSTLKVYVDLATPGNTIWGMAATK